MLSRLFPRRFTRPASRTPPDRAIWAVGGIHGRSDLADRMLQTIRAGLSAAEGSRKVIMFLGDHIDRGLARPPKGG